VTQNRAVRVGVREQLTRRLWPDYRTAGGGRPVKEFVDGLMDAEVAAIVAGIKEVAARGLRRRPHGSSSWPTGGLHNKSGHPTGAHVSAEEAEARLPMVTVRRKDSIRYAVGVRHGRLARCQHRLYTSVRGRCAMRRTAV
jgi:hypothetical protein